MAVVTKTDLPLPLLASGKGMLSRSTSIDVWGDESLMLFFTVRDVYEIPGTSDLLFVATDRISCYDVVGSQQTSLHRTTVY